MTTASANSAGALGDPAALDAERFEIAVRRLADEMVFGAEASVFVGPGLEYAQSRPYQAGDSVRSFNWRLTARSGKPFVKEYDAPKRIETHIVVDTSPSMCVGSTAITKQALAVWIAAGIGLVRLRQLSPVCVSSGDERAAARASLRRADLLRSIDWLRRGKTRAGALIGPQLSRLERAASRTALAVIISDLQDPGSIEAVRRCAQRHDCAVIHLCDPAETRLRAGFIRAAEAESGVAFTTGPGARWNGPAHIRTALAESGIDCVQLGVHEPFTARLREFLTTRNHRGGRS